MACAENLPPEVMLRRAMRHGPDDCLAFAVNPAASIAGDPLLQCGHDVSINSLVAAMFDPDGLVWISPAALGDVNELGCDDTARTLNDLLAEVMGRTDDGGIFVNTWDDGAGAIDCDAPSCDDMSTTEQMLRGCFMRLDNGELRLRVVYTNTTGELACDDAIGSETLLRRAIHRIAPSRYAIRIAA